MSAVDEEIVREYFEQNGFFSRQVKKYQVQSRKKTGEEEIDLLVFNPSWVAGAGKPDFFLFASELGKVRRGVVSVKPWHSGVFTPTMLKSSPEIFGFLEETVLKEAERFFPVGEEGDTELFKILVLPGIPTQEPFRSQSVELLKEKGVDAIISFRAILLDLIDRVEVNLSYRKSEMLQLLRVLKNYDLLKSGQMDLLNERAGRKRG